MANNEHELIRTFTAGQIHKLQAARETGGGKALLAELRRGIGKVPGELPELWGVILGNLPQALYSNTGVPSKGEWAVYLSLTMYALHQQGSTENMHCSGISLGAAASALAEDNSDEAKERVMNRFGPVVTARDIAEISNHLRGLVQLFRAKSIKLDYIKLAEDLYDLQSSTRHKVQLRWGEDFYRDNNKGDE